MDDSNEDQRTVWCGNLSEKITEEVLYELFLQAAPLQRVRIPKDKDGKQSSYGFVTFKHVVSVQYATELLNGIAIFDKKINIKPRNGNLRQQLHHRDNSPVCMQPQSPIPLSNILGTFQEVNMLMHMGDQLLLNNKVQTSNNSNNFGFDNRTSTPYRRWEHSNYRDDRREDNRPYRRHGNHRNSSDRHNTYNQTPYRGGRRYEPRR